MNLISQGAEAKLYLEGDKIIKKRIPKRYRLKEIDEKLRKFRTRREAKVLKKLPKEVPAPELISMNDTDMEITMSNIQGEKVKDVLDQNPKLSKQIGKKLALMHNAGIIHGDLTTSNMILSGNEVFFIDFGLSFFSEKYEDKAVDLHLLKRALNSKHYRIAEKVFEIAIESYQKQANDANEILNRLEKVERRGRHKKK